MGRETKIGLAIVGTLLIVFGALLVYRFVGPLSPADVDSERVATYTASTGSNDRATMFLAQQDRAAGRDAAGRDAAGRDAAEPNWAQTGEPTSRYGDGPPSGYLPAERATDRYGRALDEQEPEARPTLARDPFSRAASDDIPAADEPDPRTARDFRRANVTTNVEASDEEPLPASRVRNPLRRLSSEEPIDDPTSDSAGLAPIAARTDDSFELPRRAEIETAELPRRYPSARDERLAPVAGQGPQSRWQMADDRPLAPTGPPADGKYTVGPNDTLWRISEKVYGTGRYFKALAEYNKYNLKNPDRLSVGTVIGVPAVSLLEQKYPSLVPKQRKSVLVEPRTIQASARQRVPGGNTYVVEAGDTLFDIARYELGKASRWSEIYELNRNVLGEDFDYLQPGTPLAMPPRSPSDPMTRSRDGGLQR